MEKDKWAELFGVELIDLTKVKKLVYKEGLPNNLILREQIWKLFIGYYTPRKREWKLIDQNCLDQYEKYVQNIYPITPSHFLDKAWMDSWKTTQNTVDTYHLNHSSFILNEIELKRIQLIEKDIARTVIGAPNNRDAPVRHDLAFRRILFILSLVNGGISYVQGMNNICNVFYTLFASLSNNPNYKLVESQTFGCMLLLIDSMRSWFISSNDNLPGGINDSMKQVDVLLEKSDKKLYEHLKSLGIESGLYVFRWLTLLCCMEFTLSDTFKYWDFFLVDLNGFPLLKATCCGLITSTKKYIANKDFALTLETLQNLPSIPYSKVMKKTKKILRNVMHYKVPLIATQQSIYMFMQTKSPKSESPSFGSLISISSVGSSSKTECKQMPNTDSLSIVSENDSDLHKDGKKEMPTIIRRPMDQSKRRVINFKNIKQGDNI